MTAAAALARAEAVRARLILRPDGGVRMEAAKPPPPDVVADLRRWRDDVTHLVAARAALGVAHPAPDWRALPFGPERGEPFMAWRSPQSTPDGERAGAED